MFFTAALAVAGAAAQPASDDAAKPRGLQLLSEHATPGFTLFAPLTSKTTYLIDLDGRVAHTWSSDFVPSAWVYLLDNGHLLRGGRALETSGFSGGGQGGRFQEFDFDGNLLWDYSINSESRLAHHDVAVLPNGNVLAIVWQRKTAKEALDAGRHPAFVPDDGVWADVLVELEPLRPDGARIVWEWDAWDHIVQNVDPDLAGYAQLSANPHRADVNGDTIGTEEPPEEPTHDIFHFNSVAYNASLDQVIVSVPTFNEIWVIDHSTSTAEAAGSTGGRAGRGGDLLYRWGNPEVYGRGGPEDRRLGFEHDARWIAEGRPGAGNITVFSNRTPGPDGPFTQVYEIAPPISSDGRYILEPNRPFGPSEAVWTYADPGTFEATYISGAERLASGNTLVTSGPQGRLFEIDEDGQIVWEYWSPFGPDEAQDDAGGQRNPFAIFRAIRIPYDHPGLRNRGLRAAGD